MKKESKDHADNGKQSRHHQTSSKRPVKSRGWEGVRSFQANCFRLHKKRTKILEVAAKSTGAGKKNASQGVYPKLEEALLVWLNAMTVKKIPVSGDIMKQKAEVFVLRMNMKDFKFSDGSLRNFKNRNDLKF
ncbi:hypothetical protein HPB48_015050 [Haemaphysalis longicornis]|uniref:HTH CENPB-type domain-containing protein n=1 Tax=Haemaphysalis longicornis TaxID=44386 RepID=A0A9J6FM58_HAELO|nr:hypothetical protein HPB48_015050 [Haemaphysalis longicornis]